jgi:polysaccharide deacetylase family protein (PEP-CTERM system associated)
MACRHHFTVDVEEYFQVSAFEGVVARESWGSLERRVVPATEAILELLAAFNVRGTFFVLGWVAEHEPALVRAIAAAGHEVASHGRDHRRVTHQTRDEFRGSVRHSKQLLEDLTGRPVAGFRAPSFSITPGLEWAFDILIEEGYAYDSSLLALGRRGYGYAGAATGPTVIQRSCGRLVEVPPTALYWRGRAVSAAGGAYFRHLPYGLVRRALCDAERRGERGTFYVHPWELDPGQPRMRVPLSTRIRHYGGLGRTAARVRRLLAEFRWRTVEATARELAAAPPAPGSSSVPGPAVTAAL